VSSEMARPYRIGLTGNIACGKSTVLRELKRLGAATLDADQVAHRAMRRGTAVYRAVVAAFGEDILGPEGEIDRRTLGKIVFADPAALARLDAIKLFEAGIAERCDEVWVVICPQEEQLRRLVEYRGLSREEALLRIHAQPPQEEKAARADEVIDNSGTPEETLAQVRAAWARMQKRRRGHFSDSGEDMASAISLQGPPRIN